MPRVSVIIPTYNRKDYVQEAIDSVLVQTYDDYEIIVVDDGSTDGTGDILRTQFGARLRYEWQENRGESSARNRGISLAQGEYVAFLDSDDLALPRRLARAVDALDSDPGVGMVSGQALLIDAQGKRIESAPLGVGLDTASLTPAGLLGGNLIAGPSTVTVRKRILDDLCGFDESLRYGEDWDLWIRISSVARVVVLPEPLAYLRRHLGTQCYYPEKTKNARRLADHLHILDKAAEMAGSSISSAQVRTARARQYFHFFCAEVAVGNHDLADHNLSCAISDDGDLAGDESYVLRTIVDMAAIVAENGEATRARDSLDFARSVLERLRDIGTTTSSFRRRVLAEVSATLGYLAMRRGRTLPSLALFGRALVLEPARVKSRGFMSLVFSIATGRTGGGSTLR